MDTKTARPTAPPNKNGSAPKRAPLSANAKELCLRFVCPHCQHWLSVPIRSLGMTDKCPGCQAVVKIPGLDGYVVGLDDVLKTRGDRQAVAFGCGCPTCEAIVPLSAADYGRPLHCGGCGEWFVLGVQTADAPTRSKTSSTPRKENAPQAAVASAGGGNVPPPASAPPPVPPPPPPQAPVPSPGASGSPSKNGKPESFSGVESNYYRAPAERRQKAGSLFGPTSVQRCAHWLSWGLYLGGIVLVFVTGSAFGWSGPIALSVLWMLPVVGLNLSRRIVPFLIHSVACPRCQEVHECRGIWSCPCGYNDHREQHLLQFKCPVCEGRLGRLNCRRCESTMLLW